MTPFHKFFLLSQAVEYENFQRTCGISFTQFRTRCFKYARIIFQETENTSVKPRKRDIFCEMIKWCDFLELVFVCFSIDSVNSNFQAYVRIFLINLSALQDQITDDIHVRFPTE